MQATITLNFIKKSIKKALLLISILSFFIINTYAQCPSGQVLCGGICVDLNIDANNCGTCGNVCPSGQTCVNGTCSTAACPSGQVLCGGICVDLNIDANNCGACGNTCPSGQTCVNGTCSTAACPSGQVLCGGICVDLNTDPNNCGACGSVCPLGQVCVNGTCAANPLGINVINNDVAVVFVYPNPVNDMVSICSSIVLEGNITIKLYDSKGVLIATNSDLKKDYNKEVLSITLPRTLAMGIYYLSIESQTFNKVVKVSKQ